MIRSRHLVAATLLALAGCAAHSPYSGQESRAVKSLSADEVASLLEGRGMGYAKPAELSGYPGPMHVLELADRLALTPGQRAATEKLHREHKAQVRALGRSYVDAERDLDALFAGGKASPAALTAALERSAEAQRRVRESHLAAHLEQTRILTPAQVAEYVRLRGYAAHTH
jgi:Spy/CpxP family protein refolding chaperone